MIPRSEMAPDDPRVLLFESHKYVPLQIICIPYEDNWLVATAYGSHRTLRGEYTHTELLEFLAADYRKARANAEHRRRHEEAIAATTAQLEDDLSKIEIDI